jgi:aminopeptidase-like protein
MTNVRDSFAQQLVTERVGEEGFALAAKIFPICRSITGNGLRDTLREISTHIKFDTQEVPTETAVFDWTIPCEWNIRDADIKDSRGKKVVDFAQSNLHVMGYSVPVLNAQACF